MNFKFAKFKDTPLNRDGETLDPNANLPLLEGDVIGLSEDADGNTIAVPADADSANAQPAIGVLMEEVRPRSYWSATLHDNGSMTRRLDDLYEKERTQAGDEITYFTHGIYLEDEDGTVDFTPNEPVYLDVGGGVTQTKPTGSGEVSQKLGVAVNTTTFLLDVEQEFDWAEEQNYGDVALDGDSTNGKTTFVVPHGLGVTPTDYRIDATSADAMGDFYVSNVDADSIDVTYGTAPADGTGNVGLHFYAQE